MTPRRAKLVKHFERELRAQGLAPGTIALYRRDAERFLRFVEGLEQHDPLPRRLDRSLVAGHLSRLRAAGVGQRSLARVVSGLRRFLDWARLEGVIEGEVEIRVREKIRRRRLPRAVAEGRLEDSIARAAEGKTPARDVALLELLWGSGLRVAEVHALDLEDLDPYSRTVKVLGKGSKERIVPLTAASMDALDRVFEDRQVAPGPGPSGHLPVL